MTIREGVTNLLDRLNNSDLSQRDKHAFIKSTRERLNSILDERTSGGGSSEDFTSKLRKISQRIDNAVENGFPPRQAAKLQERIKNALEGEGEGGGEVERRDRPQRRDDPRRLEERVDTQRDVVQSPQVEVAEVSRLITKA